MVFGFEKALFVLYTNTDTQSGSIYSYYPNSLEALH